MHAGHNPVSRRERINSVRASLNSRALSRRLERKRETFPRPLDFIFLHLFLVSLIDRRD